MAAITPSHWLHVEAVEAVEAGGDATHIPDPPGLVTVHMLCLSPYLTRVLVLFSFTAQVAQEGPCDLRDISRDSPF